MPLPLDIGHSCLAPGRQRDSPSSQAAGAALRDNGFAIRLHTACAPRIRTNSRTLEDLILGDERAVCMARFHLDRHRARLQDVPPAGERVELVELGTHCRGAEFVDGKAVLTPALEEAFDEVARGFDGFCFGRFDVRTPAVEDFRRSCAFARGAHAVWCAKLHHDNRKRCIFHCTRPAHASWGSASGGPTSSIADSQSA